MTDTDHQPHTTTDDLTNALCRHLRLMETERFGGLATWTISEVARALLTSGPLADRLNAQPCPTCVREGGPYRCCPHCADDPIAHEHGQRNHHDLPCTTCVRELYRGDR